MASRGLGREMLSIMNSSFKIGRVSGIEIGVHPTWLIAFAFIAWTLAGSFYPSTFHEWSQVQYWVAGVLTSLVLFASVLVHELAHSLVAQKLGLPVKGITLFIFGGVSEITGKYQRARDEFLVAFAGPASSLVLGLLLILVWMAARPERPSDTSVLMGIVFFIGRMNIVLGVFNLLPGFPLDGGRVLRSLVWGWTGNERKAMRVAGAVGRFVAWGLIGIGVLRFFQGDYVGGLWMAFIGMFLNAAARGEARAERQREAVGPVSLRTAIRGTPQIVEASRSVADVMARVVGRGLQQVVPVVEEGEPVGYFTEDDARRFPNYEWVKLSVGAAIKREPPYLVQFDHDAVDVLDELQARGLTYALVLSGPDVVGVVDVAGLETAIRFYASGGGAPLGQTRI